tara:strand:+ start:3449 stop:3628 length:180 start_codon:yes stop_codon:yes gene_type:complete
MEKIKKEKIELNMSGKGQALMSALRIFLTEGSLLDKDIKIDMKVEIKEKDLYGDLRSEG